MTKLDFYMSHTHYLEADGEDSPSGKSTHFLRRKLLRPSGSMPFSPLHYSQTKTQTVVGFAERVCTPSALEQQHSRMWVPARDVTKELRVEKEMEMLGMCWFLRSVCGNEDADATKKGCCVTETVDTFPALLFCPKGKGTGPRSQGRESL